MSITVLRAGLLTTLQDLGRNGYQKYGVIVGGAMDNYSLRIANILTGNEENAAALEMTLTGPSLQFEQDTVIAITGGNLSPTIAGSPVPMWRPVTIKKDSILDFGPCRSGCRAYMAVSGGFTIPKVLGSNSTYLRAGIGGYEGRALQGGDILPVGQPLIQPGTVTFPARFSAPQWYAGKTPVSAAGKPVSVRVLRGGQFNQFSPASQQALFQDEFRVTPRSDRMGYRLSGPALTVSEPRDMISEAVSLGTIQVPPDGNPIVLLADRQTTGGYPKIAQVVLADIPRIAQSKPGTSLRFQEVSLDEAESLYLENETGIRQVRAAIEWKRK